jgi:hypothetical protein
MCKSTQIVLNYVLFDITKGTFQGKVVIPRKDKCYKARYNYDIDIGWHWKIVIICGRRGVKIYATVYDSVESNLTGDLNLILSNGMSFRLRNKPLISNSGDVYSNRGGTFTVYRRRNRYKPFKQVTYTQSIRGCGIWAFRLDKWSDMPNYICVPGPVAIAFLNQCVPANGIVEKGSSNMPFYELIPSFHPPSKDDDVDHFYFSMDGSLLHLIENPNKTANVKEHLLSVDIYTRIMA